MSEFITFPDPVEVFGMYLKKALAAAGHPVTVSTQVPTSQPRNGAQKGAFIRIDVMDRIRTGLTTENVTITLEAYADGADTSNTLAGIVRAIAWAAPDAPGLGVLSLRELSGPAPLADPRTDLHRTSQTVVIALRGAAH